MNSNHLLTTPEAAAFLRLAPGTLQNWRCRGEGPRFIQIGTQAVRYALGDLEAYVDERSCRGTSRGARAAAVGENLDE